MANTKGKNGVKRRSHEERRENRRRMAEALKTKTLGEVAREFGVTLTTVREARTEFAGA